MAFASRIRTTVFVAALLVLSAVLAGCLTSPAAPSRAAGPLRSSAPWPPNVNVTPWDGNAIDTPTPLIVAAADTAQYLTTAWTAVRVDTTPPVVTVSYPPDGLETNVSTALIRGTIDNPNATVLVDDQMIRPDASGHWRTSIALVPGGNTVTVSAVDAAGNRAAAVVIHVTFFSPIPALQEDTSSNAQALEAQAAALRFSLVAIVLLFTGITFVLYSRTSRRLREDRRIIVALARRLPPKR